MSATVRISDPARRALRDLARSTGEPMSAVLDKAIECYRRQRFLEETNAGFAALRADEEAWEHELRERRIWEATLADDLEPEP